MEKTDVNPTKVDDVVQGCYHHSPNSNNQPQHNVDHKQQVGEKKEALSESNQRIYFYNLTGLLIGFESK